MVADSFSTENERSRGTLVVNLLLSGPSLVTHSPSGTDKSIVPKASWHSQGQLNSSEDVEWVSVSWNVAEKNKG